MICIQFNNCDSNVTYHLEIEEELNSVIIPFVLNMMFYHVGLLWIIDNNNHYNFERYLEENQWMDKGT